MASVSTETMNRITTKSREKTNSRSASVAPVRMNTKSRNATNSASRDKSPENEIEQELQALARVAQVARRLEAHVAQRLARRLDHARALESDVELAGWEVELQALRGVEQPEVEAPSTSP